MAKFTDSDPLTDKEVYGKAEPRSYRDAVTPEQLKLLKSAGQEPKADQDAQAAAADSNAPAAVVPDPPAKD